MNVGMGIDHSVNEHYQAAADTVGFTGKFARDLSRPVGMQRKLLNVSLATEWGWTAKTALPDGLEDAYAWYCTEVDHGIGKALKCQPFQFRREPKNERYMGGGHGRITITITITVAASVSAQ